MPDPRSVMKEFRFLDQKRAVEGLSAEETARYDALRDLVGPDTASPGARPGFDVGAAAARLRESLMPAGLRNRPPPTPELSPEPIGEIEPAAPEPTALEAAYQVQPFEPLEPLPAEGGLFDPISLGSEAQPEYGASSAAYDPNAPAWDPNAPAYDPNAAAYDPNAPAAWDPNAPAYDPNAAAYDPNAPAAWDPNALAYDPNAAAYDPNAPAWDPNAPAYDPNAAAYDPNAPAWDPNAPAYDPNAAAYDPNAPAAWDPNAPAYDPNAAAYDPNAPAWDPNAPAYAASEQTPSFESSGDGLLEVPAAPSGQEDDWSSVSAELESPAASQLPEPEVATLEAEESLFEQTELPAPLPGEGEEPAWAPAPGGEYDAAAWDTGATYAEPPPAVETPPAPADDLAPYPPQGWSGEPELAPQPTTAELGSYDDTAAPSAEELEGLLPFDPAAEAAVTPGTLRAFGGEGADLGRGFGAPGAPGDLFVTEGFHAAPSLVAEEAPGWQVEPAAVDQGFQLESGGSFDAAADAVAPAWASPPQEPMAWESVPQAGSELAAPDPYASSPLPDPAAAAQLDYSSPELGVPEEEQAAEFGWEQPAPESAPPAELEPLDVAGMGLDLEPEPLPAPEAPAEASGLPQDVDVTFLGSVPEPAAEELPILDDADLVEEVEELPAQAAPELLAPLELEAFAAEQPPAPEPTPAAAAEPYVPPEPEAQVEYAAAPYVPPEPEAQVEYAAAPYVPPEPEAQVEYAAAPYVPPEPAPHAAAVPLAFASAAAPPVEEAQPLEVIEALEPEPEPELLPAEPAPAPGHVVSGVHRVVIHTLEGQVKRGFLQDADLAAPSLPLVPAPGAAPEPLAVEHVKAVFFMLAPGEQPPAPEGNKVRVVFRDGRQVAGFSPDYQEGAFGFFMIPADTRTSTGRIWVYQTAVRQVAVT